MKSVSNLTVGETYVLAALLPRGPKSSIQYGGENARITPNHALACAIELLVRRGLVVRTFRDVARPVADPKPKEPHKIRSRKTVLHGVLDFSDKRFAATRRRMGPDPAAWIDARQDTYSFKLSEAAEGEEDA